MISKYKRQARTTAEQPVADHEHVVDRETRAGRLGAASYCDGYGADFECQRSPSWIHRRSAKRIQSLVQARVAPLGASQWARQIGQAGWLVAIGAGLVEQLAHGTEVWRFLSERSGDGGIELSRRERSRI